MLIHREEVINNIAANNKLAERLIKRFKSDDILTHMGIENGK